MCPVKWQININSKARPAGLPENEKPQKEIKTHEKARALQKIEKSPQTQSVKSNQNVKSTRPANSHKINPSRTRVLPLSQILKLQCAKYIKPRLLFLSHFPFSKQKTHSLLCFGFRCFYYLQLLQLLFPVVNAMVDSMNMKSDSSSSSSKTLPINPWLFHYHKLSLELKCPLWYYIYFSSIIFTFFCIWKKC